MKFRSERITVVPVAMICVLLLGAVLKLRRRKSRDWRRYSKNLQVLRGPTMDEFMGSLGFIAAAPSVNGIDCHSVEAASDVTKYARLISLTHFNLARG